MYNLNTLFVVALYLKFTERNITMPINVNLDVMMAKRKISSGELAARIGLSQANLSILKTGKARAVRFSTLEAICKVLGCQPGDILEFDDTAHISDNSDKERDPNGK